MWASHKLFSVFLSTKHWSRPVVFFWLHDRHTYTCVPVFLILSLAADVLIDVMWYHINPTFLERLPCSIFLLGLCIISVIYHCDFMCQFCYFHHNLLKYCSLLCLVSSAVEDGHDDDENSYDFLRQAVKEYWVTMKEYYKAVSCLVLKTFWKMHLNFCCYCCTNIS